MVMSRYPTLFVGAFRYFQVKVQQAELAKLQADLQAELQENQLQQQQVQEVSTSTIFIGLFFRPLPLYFSML